MSDCESALKSSLPADAKEHELDPALFKVSDADSGISTGLPKQFVGSEAAADKELRLITYELLVALLCGASVNVARS
jgi:hypothetical protein